ncbi:MAG: acyl-CoA dehydrogenase family protein [Burkholderiales bacterium]|nr:acyl-CoA dehydrogenase family protein [Burkholderiales bacterium]MBH2015553.1 acyl-CoA dehydrogenase family protein [Burkholderiales bacterium]
MNFTHTEDRRMLADTLGRYVAEQAGFDDRMATAASPEGFSRERWAAFAELGAIGALFGEADGGYGGAGFDLAVVFEALGQGLVLEPFLPALLAGSAVAHAGTAEQKMMLAPLIEGRSVATLAHEEPESFFELNRVATRATRQTHSQGDGWVLQGRKTAVPLGDQADWLVVSARTSGAVDDAQGVSLFLVPTDAPGLVRRGWPSHDGSRVADIALDGLELPASALLGGADQAGQGLATLEHAVGRGILALCAEGLGAMEAAKRMTIEYLQTRKQFGVPIGSFQALQHRMADVLLEVEQMRSAVINAAAALESDRTTRERALSAAKVSIGRIGTRVAQEAIQLHGGIGMTWELPLSHHAKRLVLIDAQLGDEDHHLARFIELGHAA